MSELNLSKYGISGATEIVRNPSYDMLFAEEMKPELEGYEKGQISELGAVNVMRAACSTCSTSASRAACIPRSSSCGGNLLSSAFVRSKSFRLF